MTTDPCAVAQRLYDGLNRHEPASILAVLDPDFVGVVSAGMPCGVGGRHVGAETMLRDCWGRIFTAFDIALEVEQRIAGQDDRVVFTGRYVGVERGTGRSVDASFAHVLRIDGERISELHQFTDTARWGFAPES